MENLENIEEKKKKQIKLNLKELVIIVMAFICVVLASTRLAYILIYEANNNIPEYKEWLKSIKNLRTNDSWIVEVTEFAVDHFC